MKSNQSGRTLIEVMIAVTIGLIMTAAVMGAFVSGQQTNSLTNAQVKLTQDTNFALDYLGRQIRQAGYGEIASSIKVSDAGRYLVLPSIDGCDGGYLASGTDKVPAVAVPPTFDACASPVANASDSISLSVQLEPVNCDGVPPVVGARDFSGNTGWGADALGDCVQAVLNERGLPISQVTNRFAIVTPAPTTNTPNPVSALYVRSSLGGSSQPLIDNIEQMRVRYLVSTTDIEEGDRYMTATQMRAASARNRIMGVELCVLASTETQGSAQTSATLNSYTDCFGSLRPGTDTKLRKTATALFVLRNRATGLSHTRS